MPTPCCVNTGPKWPNSNDGAAVIDVDFLVVGAGIAGASAAYWLSPHGRTVVLERESQPGYHSTGRSAALFSETYGPAQVRALSRASGDFLWHPPEGFADHPILTPRGTLIIGDPGDPAALDSMQASLGAGAAVERWSHERALATVPVLRPELTGEALHAPGAADIDVHTLHQGYLRGLKRAGGEVVCGAEVVSLERVAGRWQASTADGRQWRARRLLNAAGAWADQLAALAGLPGIGLVPKRRSAFVFAPPAGLATAHWPLVLDVAEQWYFKPDAGQLLGSPANADPVPPHDVQAEELDIALAIDRIQTATTLTIRRPSRVWAGLRSFVADGELVGGARSIEPGFIWVAAQGGYGIQTSAAMGRACASLALGQALPDELREHGVSAAALSPERPGLTAAG